MWYRWNGARKEEVTCWSSISCAECVAYSFALGFNLETLSSIPEFSSLRSLFWLIWISFDISACFFFHQFDSYFCTRRRKIILAISINTFQSKFHLFLPLLLSATHSVPHSDVVIKNGHLFSPQRPFLRCRAKSYWILHFTFEAPVGVFESRFRAVSARFSENFRRNHSRDRSIFDLIDFPIWFFIIRSTFQWKPLREHHAIRLIGPRSKQRMRVRGEREKQLAIVQPTTCCFALSIWGHTTCKTGIAQLNGTVSCWDFIYETRHRLIAAGSLIVRMR